MSGLFGRSQAPTPQPSAPMPDPELSGQEAAMRARRDVLARAGRASTILTAPQSRRPAAGAAPTFDSYAAKTLGGS